MTTVHHFIEPLDVLFLRGNRLFGDPGSYGEILLPPWPSVAAGALRSALLAHKRIDISRFAQGLIDDPELGTPAQPGSFVLTAFHLARRQAEHATRIEPLFQPPADLVIKRNFMYLSLSDYVQHKFQPPADLVIKRNSGGIEAQALTPRTLHEDILCSQATSSLAVLAETKRGKSEGGFWLTVTGWERYLRAEAIDPNRHLVKSDSLWHTETRVGVGLDSIQRRAADGALFSMEALSLHKAEHARGKPERGKFDVGFLVETDGVRLPDSLTLRFGGDGRGALSRRVEAAFPEPDYNAIARARRCRLVLTTPGIFTRGWQPTGTSGEGLEFRFDLHGVKGRLTCAAVPRAETVSGFDVAKRMPKPAQRVAPTGSVYWLEDLETTPNALRNLAARGLWSDSVENESRRAEGFNRVAIGAWLKE